MNLKNTVRKTKINSAKRLVFISYWSIVLFMSLIIIVFIVFSFYKSRAYIKDTQMNQLNTIKYTFDTVFRDVKAVVHSLNTNQAEKITCMPCEEFYDPNELDTIVAFQKDRLKVMMYSDNISQLYLFNVKVKTAISDTIYHEDALPRFFSQLGIDSETFYESMSELTSSCYRAVYDGNTLRSILYMECIYISSYKVPEGILIAEIPYEKILKIKGSLTMEKTQVILGWENDEGILCDEENSFDSQNSMSILPMTEYFTGKGLNKEVYSYEVSDYAPVRYYYVSRYVDYIHEVLQLIIVAFFDLLVAITGAVVLSLYFGRKNYLPLQRIMTMLGHTEPDFSLQSLESEISSGLNKRMRLENEIKKSRVGQIKTFIYRMMNHKITNKEFIDKNLEQWNLKFGDRLYVASVIIRDDFEQDDQERDLMLFALENIFKEYLGEKYQIYVISDYNKLIILEDLSADQTLDIFCRDCQNAMEMCTEWFGMHTVCAVSGCMTSIYDIDEGYMQILAIGEYYDIKGSDQKVLCYDQLLSEKDEESNIFYYKLNKYMNMILAQDYKGAQELFKDIYESDLGTDVKSVKYSRMRMLHLISMIVVPYRENGGTLCMDDLGSDKSLEELYTLGCDIFTFMMPEYKVTAESVTESARKYIQEHALEYNISVVSISEAVGVSASYLSRIFKKEVGIGVLDYLHHVRMAYAKVLLKNGYTVVDAAQQTGYLDAKAFIRVFKRYEGITPGQYKNI